MDGQPAYSNYIVTVSKGANKPTRWGFMGCGKVASDFATALELLPKYEHKIVAVAASDLKRAKEFSYQFGVKRFFEGYENIATCPDVDIVYVNVIHPHHLHCVKLALNAGKAVLCEKPLGLNKRQVQEMIQLARQKGVFFMEAFWSRCFPVYREIRRILNDGEIGEPKFLQGQFGSELDRVDYSRVFEKKLGGSILLNLGCYLVMVATMVFDGQAPESIEASGKLNKDGVDVMDCVTLKYKNNVVAELVMSAELELPQCVTVYGTEGQLQMPESYYCPTKLVVNDELIEYPLPDTKGQHYFYKNSQGLMYEAQHIRQCLLKGLKESPLMPLKHSEVIISVMDEIRRQVGVVYSVDLP